MTTEQDRKTVRPYGDTTGDGRVSYITARAATDKRRKPSDAA